MNAFITNLNTSRCKNGDIPLSDGRPRLKNKDIPLSHGSSRLKNRDIPRRRKASASSYCMLCLIVAAFETGYLGHILIGRLRASIDSEIIWSIGIGQGMSPLNIAGSSRWKPVLTAMDVTDTDAKFVADPFMLKEGGTWHMFFEILQAADKKGVIGHATSGDGLEWKYDRVVLDEPFHMSYPYVFKHEGGYYMIPESSAAYGIRLYKAAAFPYEWKLVKVLISGEFCDTSVVRYKDSWWMITSDIVGGTARQSMTRVFYSDRITGPWKEHSQSPFAGWDQHRARSGGRILLVGNALIRFAQDGVGYYGNRIRAFRITELTPDTFKEVEYPYPVIKGEAGWNAMGMHQFDPHLMSDGTWFACVDGQARMPVYKSRLVAVIATFVSRLGKFGI